MNKHVVTIVSLLVSSTAFAQSAAYPGFSLNASSPSVAASSVGSPSSQQSGTTLQQASPSVVSGPDDTGLLGSLSTTSDPETALLLGAGIPVAGSWTETATRDYYNGDLHLAWLHTLGDYQSTALGTAKVPNAYGPSKVNIPVTGSDFYIKNMGGGRTWFGSRAAGAAGPVLVVNGSTIYQATRNVTISPSLSGTLGGSPLLNDSAAVLIAFDNYVAQPGDSARLVLTSQGKSSAHQLSVYRPKIQYQYPVIDATAGGRIVRDIRAADFKPASNISISNGVVTGTWGGSRLGASSQIFGLPPADEYYMTVVIRLGSDWPNQGGKLPGLTDTGMVSNSANVPLTINGVNCNNAGWGGRTATGCRWSARTGWGGRIGDQVGLRTYFYAQRPSAIWGIAQPWPTPVSVNQWFAYVQRVKLNTPGQADGRLSYWLCTEQGCATQFDRKDITWRGVDLPQTKISEVWANVYCGGTSCGAAPYAAASVNLKRMAVTTGLPDLGTVLAEVHSLNQGN